MSESNTVREYLRDHNYQSVTISFALMKDHASHDIGISNDKIPLPIKRKILQTLTPHFKETIDVQSIFQPDRVTLKIDLIDDNDDEWDITAESLAYNQPCKEIELTFSGEQLVKALIESGAIDAGFSGNIKLKYGFSPDFKDGIIDFLYAGSEAVISPGADIQQAVFSEKPEFSHGYGMIFADITVVIGSISECKANGFDAGNVEKTSATELMNNYTETFYTAFSDDAIDDVLDTSLRENKDKPGINFTIRPLI